MRIFGNIYLVIITTLLVGLLVALILLFSTFFSEGSFIHYLISFIGYDTVMGFIIKILLYWLFIYSLLEVAHLKKETGSEGKALTMDLLDGSVDYNRQHLETINNKMEHLQRKNSAILIRLIGNACSALLNSNLTVSEGLSIVAAQIGIFNRNFGSRMNTINNLANTMVPLGLIGSLVGISGSLSNFSNLFSGDTTDSISTISAYMSSAWSTTLLGFIFSIIIKHLLSQLNTYSTHVSNNLKQYIIDNLFSRLRGNHS